MVYCYNCGRPSSDASNFCVNCGATLHNDLSNGVQITSTANNEIRPNAEQIRLDNRIGYSEFYIVFAGIIFSMIVGMLLSFQQRGYNFFVLVFCIVLFAVTLIFVSILFLIVLAPQAVEITSDGVIMHRKLGMGPLFVPWTSIDWVFHSYTGMSKRIWNTKNTKIHSTYGKLFIVHWQVGEAILERYKAAMGHYPKNRLQRT